MKKTQHETKLDERFLKIEKDIKKLKWCLAIIAFILVVFGIKPLF